jgi:hypothetical protein
MIRSPATDVQRASVSARLRSPMRLPVRLAVRDCSSIAKSRRCKRRPVQRSSRSGGLRRQVAAMLKLVCAFGCCVGACAFVIDNWRSCLKRPSFLLVFCFRVVSASVGASHTARQKLEAQIKKVAAELHRLEEEQLNCQQSGKLGTTKAQLMTEQDNRRNLADSVAKQQAQVEEQMTNIRRDCASPFPRR